MRFTFKTKDKNGIKAGPELLDNLCFDKVLQYCTHNQYYAMYNVSQYLRFRMRESKYFPIYSNQRKAAQSVIDSFRNKIRYAVITAETQSGKTGTCQAICYLLKDVQKELGIDLENVYFICGMNDNNLKNQQVREFEGLIPAENILFSKDLQFFGVRKKIKRVAGKPFEFFKNTLIFCDESHYAQNKGSMVHKFMTDYAGLTMDGDPTKWAGTNIYCVSISATPMSEMVNIVVKNHNNKANDEHDPTDPDALMPVDPLGVQHQFKTMVRLEPGANYYGFKRMFECKKVFKAKNFSDPNDRQSFRDTLHKLWQTQKSENRYKYAIIRFSNSGHGDQYRQAMIGLIDFPVKYIHFHSETMDIREINKILKTQPTEFTIIEVYHSLRAGIQMNTENICLVHETLSAHTDSTVQGLPGRCTGYNKEKHGVLVYCNMTALTNYVRMVEKGFDPTYTPGNSTNIKVGHTKRADQLFDANVPMGAVLTSSLLKNLKELKDNNGQYSSKFESKYLLQVLEAVKLNSVANNVDQKLDTNERTSCFVGVTILDATNRVNTATSTWAKFWDPAFKAYTNKSKGSYFRNIELPEGYQTYYYVYVNLKEGHDQYGYALVTSKVRHDNKNGTYLKTTGKEQFHAKNNVDLIAKEHERLNPKPTEKKVLKIVFKKPLAIEAPQVPVITFKKPLSFKVKEPPQDDVNDNKLLNEVSYNNPNIQTIMKQQNLTFKVKEKTE